MSDAWEILSDYEVGIVADFTRGADQQKEDEGMINTDDMREIVHGNGYKNVWLNGSTHWDGCEYWHYPCAVLALCDEVDALRADIESERKWADDYLAKINRLEKLLDAAKHGLASYAYGNQSPEFAQEILKYLEKGGE